MAEVHGFCDERFQPLEDAFRRNLESGLDKGASLAATLHGKPVVDLWGGTCDYAESKPWAEDTLVLVASTSKVMVNVTVLMMVDRGLLDLDAPIATYWPEFGQNGKGAITTRQVLVHKSGLPGFGQPIGLELRDWDFIIGVIERASLWYEPGTISCYHPMTYGFILGELVRRLSGQPFAEFFRREVAEPLGADFNFGVTSAHDQARVADIWPPTTDSPLTTPMGIAAMGECDTMAFFGPEGLAAVIPSANGLTNARAIARIGAMMAMGGEIDGRRYLSRRILDEASSEQSYAEDEIVGWCRYGLGFGLDSKEFPAPTPTTFHWGGYGGSFITIDMESQLSCAFTPNQFLLGEAGEDSEHFRGTGGLPRLSEFWQLLGEISPSLT